MSLTRGPQATRMKRASTGKDGLKFQDPDQHGPVYQQQAYRAGLLVTQELNNAITRCKLKVEEIAQECRTKNRMFRDIEFDFENDQNRCLHGLHTADAAKYHPLDVLRVSQIFDDPQFIVDGTTSSDIQQSDFLGNCWFLSAVATLSTMPDLIDKICVARDEKVGVYGFIFFRDGEWADVVIDDQLFTRVPKYETLPLVAQNLYHIDKDLYDKVARKGGKTLYFGRSRQENETWVPLLEKAYAKFHGDYASLKGGQAFEAIEDLTGGVSQVISTNEIFDQDRFWHHDLMQAAKDRLFGCYLNAFAGKGTDNTFTHGLLGAHAYSVLCAVEYKGKRFLKIRDPWAKSEWTGNWSYRSKKWTTEWHEVLRLLDHKFSDDGAFIMEYEDFLNTWYAVERTRVFDSSWVQSSHWLNVPSRTIPCAWQFGDVSFTFSLPEASPAIVVLSQSDTRFYTDISSYSEWTFDFVVYKKGTERVLGRSEFSGPCPRSVTLSQDLDAGEYVLHVRLDRDYVPPAPPSPPNVGQFTQPEPSPKAFPPVPLPTPPVLAPTPIPLVPVKIDYRKLSKVLSERARSMSITENFNPRQVPSHLVVPPETFAGRDLTEIAKDVIPEARKMNRTKFRPSPFQTSVMTSADERQSESEKNVKGHADSNRIPEGMKKTKVRISRSDSKISSSQSVIPATVETSTTINCNAVKPRTTNNGVAHPPRNAVQKSTKLKTSVEASIKIKGATKSLKSLELSHNGVICDGCCKSVVGVHWRCLECDNYDLCEDCHASRMQSLQHSVKHKTLRKESLDEPIAVHEGVICNSCQLDPVLGNRWKCLVCHDYDLCDACHAFSTHHINHTMARIATNSHVKNLNEDVDYTLSDSSDNSDKSSSNYYSFNSDCGMDSSIDCYGGDSSDDGDHTSNLEDNVVLGLRVYTKANAPVKISGQLRQQHRPQRSRNRGIKKPWNW